MRDQLQKRLQELKTEYEAGQQMLASLEAKKASLRETLLRIGGAIQVLEELASSQDPQNGQMPESGVIEAPVALGAVSDTELS